MRKVRSGFLLAAAVILLELIGGMQSYLNQLTLPILAEDFNAQALYGIILGLSAIASMVGLPIGTALLGRIQLSKVLLGATVFLVIGALVSTLAPHVLVYLLGLLIRGLAGSVLAVASMGAVVLGLSGRARQLTLAFASASWVISAIMGPLYAAWVTQLLSWRWAMLLYLPFLVVARVIIAANLKTDGERQKEPFSCKAMLLIVLGVGITVVPATGGLRFALLIAGVGILGWVAVLLLPEGVFTQQTPRRSALSGMFFLTGSYFGANELITLTSHDLYNRSADSLGVILIGGGLSWAVLECYVV